MLRGQDPLRGGRAHAPGSRWLPQGGQPGGQLSSGRKPSPLGPAPSQARPGVAQRLGVGPPRSLPSEEPGLVSEATEDGGSASVQGGLVPCSCRGRDQWPISHTSSPCPRRKIK